MGCNGWRRLLLVPGPRGLRLRACPVPRLLFSSQVQMDAYEENNGVVVLGATNRPGAIDSALMKPGRFDRVVYMPLPDAMGRAKILQVRASAWG